MIDNVTGHKLCFFPTEENCTLSYVIKAEDAISTLKTRNLIMLFVMDCIGLTNNFMQIYVFSRRGMKGNFMPRLLAVLYVGNITYLISTSIFTIVNTYPFEFGPTINRPCEVGQYIEDLEIGFINVLLTFIAILRLFMILYPGMFANFESKLKHVWGTIALCSFISFLINIDGLLLPDVEHCLFSGKPICDIIHVNVLHCILNYCIPIVLSVSCSVATVVCARINPPTKPSMNSRRAHSKSMRLYSTFNTIVLSSSLLFAVGTIPNFAYYFYYRSDNSISECGEGWDPRFLLNTLAELSFLCYASMDNVVYFVASPSYRHAVLELIKRMIPCRETTTEPDSEDYEDTSNAGVYTGLSGGGNAKHHKFVVFDERKSNVF